MEFTPEPNTYLCADCGWDLLLPEGAAAVEHFEGVPGRPIHRVVTVRDLEVHRCGSLFLTMAPQPTDLPVV
jgi:hypothetical protein